MHRSIVAVHGVRVSLGRPPRLDQAGASVRGTAPTVPRTALPRYTDYLFTAVFVVECALKIVAFGLRTYLKSGWNVLPARLYVFEVQ